MESVLVVNSTVPSETGTSMLSDYKVNIVRLLSMFVACLGAMGNWASFSTATHLPEATSKHLIKYLALFDTWNALEFSFADNIFYKYILCHLGNLQVS